MSATRGRSRSGRPARARRGDARRARSEVVRAPDVPADVPAIPLEPVPTLRVPGAMRALGYRDFRLFWSGAVLSNAGAHMQLAALGWVVAVQTRSAFRVALIGFVAIIPLFLLGPLAGTLADRVVRRRLLLLTQTVQMLLAFALFVTWELGHASYWVMFAFAMSAGSVGAINAPAWQALVPELVPRSALQNAVMLNSTQFNVARAGGPMVAGAFLAKLGAGACFLFNATSFLAVIGALIAMGRPGRREPSPRAGVLREFLDGARYVRRSRGLIVAIVTNAVVVILGAPIIHLMPILALEEFRVGPAAYGLLVGAFGVGAIVAAVVAGRADSRIVPSRVVALALVVYAGSILSVALAPVLALGILAMVGVGGGFLAIVSTTNSCMHALCEDGYRGRVMSMWLMTFGVVFPIGVIAQGALADAVGVRAVLAGVAALLVAYLAVATARRLLLTLDAAHARFGVPRDSLPLDGRSR